MRLLSDLRLSRAPIGAFVGIGVFWGSFAAMLPVLKARLEVSDALLGVILLGSAAGALLAMWLSPRLDAAMPRWGLTLSGLALGIVVLPLGLAGSLLPFVLGMVAVGMSTGMYDILGNAHISRLEARHRVSLMNLNHAIYSLAYAGASTATGVAREAGLAPGLWFAVVGAVILLVGTLTWTRPGAPAPGDGTPQESRGRITPYVWCAGLVCLIGFFAENATEGWSALHIERTLGGGAAEGALGPAMLGLTMGVGRLAGHLVTVRGTETVVLRWAALLAASGLVAAAAAPVPLVAYLGFGCLGLGVSVTAPLALALAGQTARPEARTYAVSRAAMIGYFGFFIGPPLMGFLSEVFGLRVAFGIGAAMILAIPLFLVPRMRALGAA
ncbi:MFS transporter [Rhodobacterales bacterium HKCCSP123]|nr:MFS transporter [Rhodobacterales bacterium HKCCSP123]